MSSDLITFGDDSVGKAATCFAYVSLEADAAVKAAQEIRNAILDAGASSAAKLHARVLFNGDRRSRSHDWGHLGRKEVEDLYDTVLAGLRRAQAKYALGFIMAKDIVTTLPLGPVTDDTGRVVEGPSALEIDAKSFIPLCSLAARMALTRAHNLSETTIWHDPDTTPSTWLDGTKRQTGIVSKRGFAEGMPQAKFGEGPCPLPELLSAADMVAYFAQRSGSEELPDFGWFSDRLYDLQPHRMQLSWQDGGLVAKVVL